MALTSRPLWASFRALLVLSVSASAFMAPAFDATTNPGVQPHLQCPAPPLLIMTAKGSSKRKWSTRVMASPPSIMDRGTPKILVKDRARVSLNRTTGKITEISSPPFHNNERVQSWSAFKEAVYGAADLVTSLLSKLHPKPSRPIPTDGYSHSTRSSNNARKLVSGESPGDRLMKEFRSRALDDERETPGTAFEKFKENIYKTVDGVAYVAQQPQPHQKVVVLASPSQKTVQSFKPAVKQTFVSSPVIKEALPDLRSKSPGKRWLAELKIRNWEGEQSKKRRKYNRERAAEKFKNGAYQFGDAVVGFLGSLVELPDRIKDTSQNIQHASEEMMESVETTVTTVKEIPVQVQERLETSVETTKRVVQEVQAIPRKIQAIPEKLEDTVKAARERVEESITNVKVFVGAEKSRPAPPKVPPPPPTTAQELALKLAGGVIKGTAKAAGWMTLGMGQIVLVGAKLAYSIMADQIVQQRGYSTQEQAEVNVKVEKSTATVREEPQMTTFPDDTILNEGTPKKAIVSEIYSKAPSVANQELDIDMYALNLEVMDALELAEMAVRIADEGKNENGGNSELDDALRAARKAAILSTNEAAEIQRNMNEP